MGSVVVVGSANLDLVYTVPRIPAPGETVLSRRYSQSAGGKGQNQAVAAARAGSATVFIGALGSDEEGQVLLDSMSDCGIDTSRVRRLPEATGTAIIMVDDLGENSIVLNSGANAHLVALTEPELAAIGSADILLLQLEIPLETVLRAAVEARSANTQVLLNAAPMRDLGDELLSVVDVLVVNEHELVQLARQRLAMEHVGAEQNARQNATEPRLEEAIGVVGALVPQLVVTLGARGAIVCQGIERVAEIAAVSVEAVDTTAAGDTFCGVLASALATGDALVDAARFATVAASISVERRGAAPSIPFLAEIRARSTAGR